MSYPEPSASAGNTVTDREMHSEGALLQCDEKQMEIGDRKVTGIHVKIISQHKTTLEEMKSKFVSCLSLCKPGPHAFVLHVDTDLHFTEKQSRDLQTHLGVLGDKVWDHTIVSFYFSENMLAERSIEEYIEGEGAALQWLVAKCGNRYVLWAGISSWPDLQDKIDKMVVLNEGRHFQYEETRVTDTKTGDWKMEVQQLVELKEENEWAKSKDTPPQSEYGDAGGFFLTDKRVHVYKMYHVIWQLAIHFAINIIML